MSFAAGENAGGEQKIETPDEQNSKLLIEKLLALSHELLAKS